MARSIIFGIITLASVGIGVVIFLQRLDTLATNKRIEAQNSRIYQNNQLVDEINSLEYNASGCISQLIGLTTGSFDTPSMTPSTALFFAEICPRGVVSSSAEAIERIDRIARAETTGPGKEEMLAAARDLVAAYGLQEDAFATAYDLIAAEFDENALPSHLTGRVTSLVTRDLPEIQDAIAAYEAASHAYVYPNE